MGAPLVVPPGEGSPAVRLPAPGPHPSGASGAARCSAPHRPARSGRARRPSRWRCALMNEAANHSGRHSQASGNPVDVHQPSGRTLVTHVDQLLAPVTVLLHHVVTMVAGGPNQTEVFPKSLPKRSSRCPRTANTRFYRPNHTAARFIVRPRRSRRCGRCERWSSAWSREAGRRPVGSVRIGRLSGMDWG